jgi:hypothetical protein
MPPAQFSPRDEYGVFPLGSELDILLRWNDLVWDLLKMRKMQEAF